MFWSPRSILLDISGSQVKVYVRVSALQVATAAESFNLAPSYEFSLV